MKKCLIDTDILSYYMRGVPEVVSEGRKYLKQFGSFAFSTLTVFEILKGLRKKKLLEKELLFQAHVAKHDVLALDYSIMDTAASLLVDLEEKGTPIAHGDLFIASTALTYGLILVTNNTAHYSKIKGLELENWMDTAG